MNLIKRVHIKQTGGGYRELQYIKLQCYLPSVKWLKSGSPVWLLWEQYDTYLLNFFLIIRVYIGTALDYQSKTKFDLYKIIKNNPTNKLHGLWNPEVKCRTHKGSPTIPILILALIPISLRSILILSSHL